MTMSLIESPTSIGIDLCPREDLSALGPHHGAKGVGGAVLVVRVDALVGEAGVGAGALHAHGPAVVLAVGRDPHDPAAGSNQLVRRPAGLGPVHARVVVDGHRLDVIGIVAVEARVERDHGAPRVDEEGREDGGEG